MEQKEQAHNAQPGHVIERTDSAQPMYFSEKIARDFGAGTAGWSADRADATVMSVAEADERLNGPLSTIAQSCRVVQA